MDNWDNDPLARKNQERPAGTPGVPPSHSWEPWKCRAEVWQGRKEQRWGGKRGMEGEAIPCCASLVCNLLGYRNWNSGWDLYKEESKRNWRFFPACLGFPPNPMAQEFKSCSPAGKEDSLSLTSGRHFANWR